MTATSAKSCVKELLLFEVFCAYAYGIKLTVSLNRDNVLLKVVSRDMWSVSH